MAETNNVVTIEYNNAVMVTLAAGQTATLPCKDKSMSTDLVVSVPARLDSLMEELPATLKSNLLHHLAFDGDVTDDSGAATTAYGIVSYADGKVNQAVDLSQGYVSLADHAPGTDSFTVAFWLNIGAIPEGKDPVIFANKDWNSGSNKGYAFFMKHDRIGFNAGDGEGNRVDLCTFHSESGFQYNDWTHVICVVDRDSNQVRFWFNFAKECVAGQNPNEAGNPANMPGMNLTNGDVLHIGADINGRYGFGESGFVDGSTYMDDFMYFDKAFTSDDVIALKEYCLRPSTVLNITENGTYDVSGFKQAKVNVADSPIPIEVSTEAEMTALRESGEVGGVYKYTGTTGAYENGALYMLAVSESGGRAWRELSILDSYLTFSSPEAFTLSKYKNWDGTLEYSTDTSAWNEWDGTAISADEGKLYLRGTGNTIIGGHYYEPYIPFKGFTLTGTNISCTGNIESLLDYKAVAVGVHPTMGHGCYYGLFDGCTSLTTAPELPATTLAEQCYSHMFDGCTSLTTAPELPATYLAKRCYTNMFNGCTSLTTVPELPATTLAAECYQGMFDGCTSLTNAPELPATSLAEVCYTNMFYGCTSLTTAPELPATTLAEVCYQGMFKGCTSLTTAPELPATTLAYGCYQDMFYGCTQIKLSETQTDEYQTSYRIPTSGTGTTATNALNNMFQNTGGTFTGTPEINTTYYLHSSNSVV